MRKLDSVEPVENSDKLKPCPFCGGEACYKTPMRILTERIMTIECQACGAYPYVVSFTDDDETDKKNELTEKWNRRVYDK